jgi:hypothetical protein
VAADQARVVEDGFDFGQFRHAHSAPLSDAGARRLVLFLEALAPRRCQRQQWQAKRFYPVEKAWARNASYIFHTSPKRSAGAGMGRPRPAPDTEKADAHMRSSDFRYLRRRSGLLGAGLRQLGQLFQAAPQPPADHCRNRLADVRPLKDRQLPSAVPVGLEFRVHTLLQERERLQSAPGSVCKEVGP